MGFLSGVIAGVAIAAGAAAWYMSRSGEKFRDQYGVEKRLGELGDQFEARTKDLQAQVNTQLAEIQGKAKDAAEDATNGVGDALDSATAQAAETAASVEAEADTVVSKASKAAKDAAN